MQMMLITDYCEGGNLSNQIHPGVELKGAQRLSWYSHGQYVALGVVRALVFLHSRDVIWFDCKPSNVLLDRMRIPRICDVGLSKILTSSKTDTCQVRFIDCHVMSCH